MCRSFLDEGKVLQIKSAHDQEALGEESGDVMGHVVATSTLPATMCFTKLKPSLVCIICYVICFYSLGMSLTHIPMGIAYGTWGALGTAITPLIGYIAYRQKTSKAGLIGVLLIIIGILLMNLYG